MSIKVVASLHNLHVLGFSAMKFNFKFQQPHKNISLCHQKPRTSYL